MSGVDHIAAAIIGVIPYICSSILGIGIEIGVGGDAMAVIEILCISIVDGAIAVSGSPAGVHTGDEHRLAQIAEVRHLCLFKGDGFIDNVAQLGGR